MFVKTRIPKDTNCVRFHGSRTKDAYHLASLFLGGKGRIANALDVMEARIRYGFKHPIWGCYITTASTEWFGLDHENQPLIAVLHNPGPLFEEKMLNNYIYRRDVNHKFNVVAREIFLDVLDGKYGKVTITHLQYAIDKYNSNKHKHKYSTKGQIEEDDFIKARLGHNYEYIQAHFTGSMKENMENHKHRPGDIDTAFLQSDCSEYFPAFIGLTERGCDYTLDLERSPINLAAEATGHFISFGCCMNVNSNFVASEVDLSTAQSDCAFLAIADDQQPIKMSNKVCMYSAGAYFDKLPNLFIDNNKPVFTEIYELDEPDFFQVDKIKGWYFTQRLRKKVAVGDKQKEWFVTSNPTYSVKGEPEFLVKSLKPLGRRTIKVPMTESFYTPEQIKDAFKNPNANTFQILDGFKCKGKNYLAVV
jgi:hypothetical protein